MAMPSGSSPEKAEEYYRYLLSQHQTDGRVTTWTVDWVSLAWLWGFVIAISVILLVWIWQYRTTGTGRLYPVDRWGSYTSELARPASLYFVLLSIGLSLFAAVLVVGHLVSGQIF
jgi:hypothetical protein